VAQHGGGPGRTKGSLNKRSEEARKLLAPHAKRAAEVLREVMDDHEAPASARADAANKILDRTFGKAPGADGGTDGTKIVVQLMKGDETL
jgi:hypothetical protein